MYVELPTYYTLTFRRTQRTHVLNRDLLLRLFFDDVKGRSPVLPFYIVRRNLVEEHDGATVELHRALHDTHEQAGHGARLHRERPDDRPIVGLDRIDEVAE